MSLKQVLATSFAAASMFLSTANAQIKYEVTETDSTTAYTVYGHKPWLLVQKNGEDIFQTSQTLYPKTLDTHIQASSIDEVLQTTVALGQLALASQQTDSSLVIDELGAHVVPTYFVKNDSTCIFFFDMNKDGMLNRVIDSMQIVQVHKNYDNTGSFYKGMLVQWQNLQGPIIKYQVGKEWIPERK
jgi:hypothetical protein